MTFAVDIELISTNQRAPTEAEQKRLNRADGFAIEETYADTTAFPVWKLAIGVKDKTTLVICHPNVLGSKADAVKRLDLMRERGAKIKLPNREALDMSDAKDIAEFIAMLGSRWGKGTRKQRQNPGAPHRYKQPDKQTKADICELWNNPRTKENPDGYSRKQVLEQAVKRCGKWVKEHHIKHWCGPKRGG